MPVAVWDQWGKITRFLESARLAFARERNLWASLELEAVDEVKLSAPTGKGSYRVALAQHLQAVEDEDTLLGAVLIHSYAIAEAAASDRLSIPARDVGGIEDWGARLLAITGEDWNSLKGGLAGAVEVAVARNAYAHGARRLDETSARRLRAAGLTATTAGDPVILDYRKLKALRGRLRSLLGAGGI
jgi:hypothetical protein